MAFSEHISLLVICAYFSGKDYRHNNIFLINTEFNYSTNHDLD